MKLTFIETPLFTRQLELVGDEESYRQLQNELLKNPEKGNLVKGSGGVRKVRMPLPGSGKSGGARVMYLYLELRDIVYLLSLYTKKEKDNLTQAELKVVKSVAQAIKKSYRV